MSGNLIIVSAPSGAGKTTLVSEVLPRVAGVRPSISYTSRAPRAGEEQGVHYHFVSRAEFEALIRGGELLEWAEVHGNLYGTGRQRVLDLLATGVDVILTIDVQGAAQARSIFPEAVSIFILPPSYEVLYTRLAQRGVSSAEDLRVRLHNARHELEQYRYYDYVIVNDDLAQAVAELAAIIVAARCRRERQRAKAENLLQTVTQPVAPAAAN